MQVELSRLEELKIKTEEKLDHVEPGWLAKRVDESPLIPCKEVGVDLS